MREGGKKGRGGETGRNKERQKGLRKGRQRMGIGTRERINEN